MSTPTRSGAAAASSADGDEQEWEEDEEHRITLLRLQDGAAVTRVKVSGTDIAGSKYQGPTAWSSIGATGGEARGADLACGKGKLSFTDGTVYEGAFKDGVRHGKGKLSMTDGDVYDGDWFEDAVHGTGKLTLKADPTDSTKGGYLDGQWAYNDFRKGTRLYADGTKYIGEFGASAGSVEPNRRHGHGKLYAADGTTLLREGEWRDGEAYEPPKPTAKKKEYTKYKYVHPKERLTADGDHYVLTAKENETISQIAKELEHGCTPEQIMELNKRNPKVVNPDTTPEEFADISKEFLRGRRKFKEHNKVWLPVATCAAYLLDCKLAKADADAKAKVMEAEAAAKASKAEADAARKEAAAAKAEIDALKAKQGAVTEGAATEGAAAEAATPAMTAAAGAKHEARRPLEADGAEGDGGGGEEEEEEEARVPDRSSVEARLSALDEDLLTTRAEESSLMGKIEEMKDNPLFASAVPALEASLSEKHEELMQRDSKKRTLQQALEEDEAAAEAEEAAKQRRKAAKSALLAAWQTSAA